MTSAIVVEGINGYDIYVIDASDLLKHKIRKILSDHYDIYGNIYCNYKTIMASFNNTYIYMAYNNKCINELLLTDYSIMEAYNNKIVESLDILKFK